jgi:hypothetical protein
VNTPYYIIRCAVPGSNNQINEAIFRIVDIEYRVTFLNFLNVSFEKFLFLRIIPRDVTINILFSLYKIHTIHVRFWNKFRIIHRFCTSLQISIIFLMPPMVVQLIDSNRRIDGKPSRTQYSAFGSLQSA